MASSCMGARVCVRANEEGLKFRTSLGSESERLV